MSLLDSIKRLFSGETAGARVYVVDGAPVSPAGRSGERLSPRDQVQALQQLSRFAEREKVRMQVAFEGRALREVAHGENFGPLQVFFAENTDGLVDLLVDLARKAGRSAVVISGLNDVEKRVAEMGGALLRPSTFRKGLENGGGGGGDNRGDFRSNGGRRRRRPRGGPRGSGGRPEGTGEPFNPPAEGAPAPAPKDSVRDLIDLVE